VAPAFGARLVAPDVRPCVGEAGGLAQLGDVARGLVRFMGAGDPLELVRPDGAEGQGSSSGTGFAPPCIGAVAGLVRNSATPSPPATAAKIAPTRNAAW
jgi:hypothetical protein